MPFVDLPQHVALLSRWTHAGDPAWGVPEQFRVQLNTPYVLGYAVAFVLAPIFGEERALRLVLLAALLGLPAATYLLLRAYRRPPELCLAAFAVVLPWAVYMGFFSFVVGLPIIIVAVALTRNVAIHGRRRDVVALAIVMVLLLAAHAFAFLLGVGAVALAALGSPRRRESLVRVMAALLPGVILTAIWLAMRGPASPPEPRALVFGPPTRRLDVVMAMFGSGNADPRVVLVALAVAIVVIVAVALAYREDRGVDLRTHARHWLRSRGAAVLPFAGAAFACAVVPETAFDVYGLWQRVAPVAFVLGLGLLPWPGGASARRAMAVGLTVVALLATSTALWQILAFADTAAGLDKVVAALPAGRRLYYEAPPNAATGVAGLQVIAFRHMGAYYVAQRGGSLNYDFAQFPFQVVVAVTPGTFREPMGAFDLYLFRASPSCPAPPANRPLGKELASQGGWRAFEVAHDPARPGPTAADLPCN